MVRLPVELYEAVSKYCYRSDLTALAHVSRTTQLEAERILYRDVRFPGNSEIGAIVYVVMFCKQICQSPRRAAYVTSLQSKIWVGTKNCFSLSLRKLFSHAIASMPHLRTLRVLGSDLFDFSMLAQSHLKLWTFESDSNDRTAVSQFLINNQSDLRSISLWLILPSTVHHTLSPRLSPNLTVLVANARDTSRIMSGRPISHLCIWDYATPVFASLPEAATMIKVLRVFLVSHTVMETIARVVPNLEVVWVQLSITTLNEMEAFIIALSRLKNLRVLEMRFRTFTHWSSASAIARSVVKACQSIHTLILNRGILDRWIWKSDMSEIEYCEGIRDDTQLWDEEIEKLRL